MLEYAMGMEIKAQALYETLSKLSKDKLSKAKLKFLAETERAHKEILVALFEKIVPGKKPTPRSFEHAGEDSMKIDPGVGFMELLQTALEGEDASYRLYNHVAEKVKNPESKKLFRQLAETELQHRHHLEQEIAILSECPLPSAIEKEPWWREELD
ncbi:MAG TPA: ferritin family protein [Candidatus Ozemobacteraceae bacterium]|nr:ferritin family protein [Candidatus Ozemobacteraceae bacterium]